LTDEDLYSLRVGIVTWRRILLLFLVIVPTIFFSGYMALLLPQQGSTKLELLIVMVFTILFIWISMGFWTAVVGFVILIRRINQFNIPDMHNTFLSDSGPHARTAILMPICNEDPHRVFAGIGAVYQSLVKSGMLPDFDFFILSDTSDPDTWVEEEWCWYKLCHLLNAFERIFYRRRRVNIKRKSGNIADFCRRWGRNYRYMIVLDADSIMTGSTLMHMVKIMEQNSSLGILQTVPKGIGRDSFIARLQQFSNNIYGPMFAAGLHFWQLGDAQFWGHNAIIRVEPFMKHCALPRLSGKPPLGGEILSHDFVEAALMRRAGWAVWLACNLEGSYEEVPPTLLDDLKRDRRWCQGNLQHLRLLFTKGLCQAHRAMFLNGAMAYLSALFWFSFLFLCTTEAFYHALVQPVYFTEARSLFPAWPVWHPGRSVILLIATITILFLPKLLAILLILLKKGRPKLFGGSFNLLLSMFIEIIFSALFAPTRMLFHSKFVVLTLLGRQVGWGAQSREDKGTSWWEALKFHWAGTVLGLVWGMVTFVISRMYFWWTTPVFAGLILSIPLSVWSSRPETGRAFFMWRLLLIPEELDPPQELEWIRSTMDKLRGLDYSLGVTKVRGFIRAVVEPFVNELHINLLRRKRKLSPSIIQRRQKLHDKALIQGPSSLTPSEKLELLYDPAYMAELHQAVWELPNRQLSVPWGLAK
jgi:membrane glycosyltransferase